MAALYPHIIPEIKEWPIYKLSQRRSEFVNSIVERVESHFSHKSTKEIEDMLSKTIFKEIKRCKEDPWKVDPSNEVKYWLGLRKELNAIVTGSEDRAARLQLFRKISNRYAEEIAGSFKEKTFLRARKFLSFIFKRLLNSAAGKNHRRLWGSQYQLYERLLVKGPVEKVRELSKHGTVVMVPTHFSNLDSILIGYAVDTIMGLPAFNYGAGLNLYDLELVAYFINRLGAYKVDRRKKNPIYLDTLKTMSLEGIQSGVNTLFFPGGTRSRSGELEKSLKLGLLGTVVEAQRARLQQGETKKIFVVPLILSYHFVLESKYLIEQHLKITGQEHYLGSKDAAKSYKNIVKFLWDLFSQGSEIYLTLGEPMDVLGNRVDDQGKSYDSKNSEVDINEYFVLDGNINKSKQREEVYTQFLADKIVESYHDNNTVLSSHVIAYTLFEMIQKRYPNENIYVLVNKDPEGEKVVYQDFVKRVEATQKVLVEMNLNMKINITSAMKGDADELISTGISNMGVYHTRKPVRKDEDGGIYSEDLKLLYYYRNRLDHYDLTQKVDKLLKENYQEEE